MRAVVLGLLLLRKLSGCRCI